MFSIDFWILYLIMGIIHFLIVINETKSIIKSPSKDSRWRIFLLLVFIASIIWPITLTILIGLSIYIIIKEN
jgi:hypothetical protein